MAGGLINTQLPAICFFITVENGIIILFTARPCQLENQAFVWIVPSVAAAGHQAF